MKEINYTIDTPQSFSDASRKIFLDLLIQQGKVSNPTAGKVNRCTFLCVGKLDNEIVSIGAIKSKTNSDFDSNKADLEKFRNDFTLELGYCFTLPTHTGKGYSSTIIKLLLDKIPDTNLMASTELRDDNSMVRILERNNFKQYGKSWKSTIHKGTLGLFLRFAK